jgi:ParB/RepB/Spo0J family partition protein
MTTNNTAAAAKPKTTRTRRTKTTSAALTVVPTTGDELATTVVADDVMPSRLPVVVLHPNLRNVRRQVTDLDELADSIRVFGVLQPLTVAPHPDLPGEWAIIAGHRRHAAALQADAVDVPVIVRADLVDPVDVIAAMLAENLHRADLTPIEEATGYQQLLDLGLTEAAVAKRTGRSKATVTRRLSLLALPEQTRERIHGHQVTLDQALVLAEFADDPAALARLEEALDEYGDLRHEAERERQNRAKAAKYAALHAQLVAAGWTVATWSYDTDAPDTVTRMARPLAFHELACLPAYQVLPADRRSAAHASCEHRAAYIFPTAEDWSEVCLQPNSHKPTTPANDRHDSGSTSDGGSRTGALDLDDEDDDYDEAAEQARQQQEQTDRADCQAAARVRRDFLRAYTTGAVKLTDEQRTAIVRHVALLAVSTETPFGYPEPTALAEDLGIDVDAITDAGGDEFTVEHQLRELIRALPDPHRGLLAALTLAAEELLDRADQWTPARLRHPDPDAEPALDPLCHRAWLDLVAGPLGYEFTPWETARIDAADTHATQQQ